jgi:hypothetical protein
MQQPMQRRRAGSPAALGLILVAVGAIVLLFRQAGIDLLEATGRDAWPLFIIVPGLLLIAAAAVPEPPGGLPFAIGGAIVTTVGSLLWYQQATGNWESWAYAWALLPTAAGIALIAYGALTRRSRLVSNGLWTAAIGAGMFLVGAWFFGAIFAGQAVPLDVAAWWPVALIILGALIAVSAIVRPGGSAPDATNEGQGGSPS